MTPRVGCERCDGGWRVVTETYVDRLAPIPTPMDLALLESDVERTFVLEQNKMRRDALRDSVYPCADCNQAAFHRWAGGHLETNHDRSKCLECSELDKAAGRRRRRAAAAGPRDLVNDGPAPLPPLERRDLI